MKRQEIVTCEKCGSLRELGEDCGCSFDEKDESLGGEDPNSV